MGPKCNLLAIKSRSLLA